MLDLQESFAAMTIADAGGEATPEEAAMLRSDENVEEWKHSLLEYKSDLKLEIKRRKTHVASMRAQGVAGHELREATAASMQFELACEERLRQVNRRLGEAERLIKDLKRRRNEKNLRGASSASRRKSREQATKKAIWEHNYLRAVLHDAKRFLASDVCRDVPYEAREAMLQKIGDALYPPAEEASKGVEDHPIEGEEAQEV